MTTTLPVNFLYLGGDKCGSTWIYHILSQHPDVTLASAKELFYFDRFYDKGPDWYIRQFPADRHSLRVGEICHDYLYSEAALARIARDMPQDSRFLVTVRAPLPRAVSHYKYMRKVGRTKLPFDEAIKAFPEILENSRFGKHVGNAVRHLGAERVKVLRFEDLSRDATAFGQSMCAALDIPFVPDLPYTDRVLEAQGARNPALVYVLRNAGWLIRQLGQPRLVSAVKSSPLVSKILFSGDKSAVAQVEMTKELTSGLAAGFAEDQAQLDALIGPGTT